MQRLFSSFPGRWPGVGLLLLRLVIGSAAGLQGAACLIDAAGLPTTALVAAAIAIGSGVALLAGFFTPAATVLAGTTLMLLAWTSGAGPGGLVFDRNGASALAAVAVAIVFVGPGALSVDAHFFGRREIVFPHTRRPSHDGGR